MGGVVLLADVLGISPEGWAALGSVGTLLAVVVAVLAMWRGRVSELRRTQPIVIAHGAGERRFEDGNEGDPQALDTWLSSEGASTAFNVRFGVQYRGKRPRWKLRRRVVRFPWKFREEDPDSGSRQRLIRPQQELPGDGGRYAIPIPWARAMMRSDDIDEKRVYWCRYENATGQTWETMNPAERGSHLQIRRRRFRRIREWIEGRRLRNLRREFAEFDRALTEMMRQSG
jgi:hypothetical protein